MQIFQVMATDAEYDAGDEVLERLRLVLAGVDARPDGSAMPATCATCSRPRSVARRGGCATWRSPPWTQLRTLVADDLDPIAAQEETA